MQYNRNLRVALMLAGLAAAPAEAAESAVDQQMLMQAYEKLLRRVDQLEASNKKLEAALEQNAHKPAVENQTTEMAGRVEDLENQVLQLKKPSESGLEFGASMTMVALDAVSGTVTGKE